MADTAVAITAGSGTNIDTRTESTNSNHRQVIVIGDPATNAGVAPVDATTGLAVNVTNASLTVASHAVTNAGTFAVQNTAATPAGTNNIGDVDVLTIAAGDNNIGNVDIVTVPTDPFGANADAASATGSISAKLRGVATALGVTALDLGVGTGGSRTLRVAIDSAQLDGSEYETVAASQTAQVLGATGGTGDYISKIVVIPATTSPGNILLLDNATSITVFAGGASSVLTLHPFVIDLGMFSVSGAWKITTGANVSAIGIGNFT